MHRIASLDLDDEADIKWGSLRDPSWDMWSSTFLQSRWKQFKASCDADDGVKCHRGKCMAFICQSFLIFLIDIVQTLVARMKPRADTSSSSTPSNT